MNRIGRQYIWYKFESDNNELKTFFVIDIIGKNCLVLSDFRLFQFPSAFIKTNSEYYEK